MGWMLSAGLAACAGDTGPEGPSGPAGPAGPTGAAGAKGDDGLQGSAGPQGPQGPAGAAGAEGPAGAAGEVGARGPAGADGATGTQGPAGADGAVGPQGPAGPAGASTGLLSGAVTEAVAQALVADAVISFEPAGAASVLTAADGTYSVTLPAGVYAVTAKKGSWPAAVGTASVLAGQAATVNLEIQAWNPRSDICLICHDTLDSRAVADYKASTMAQEVACQDCHGTDLNGGPGHNPRPSPETCRGCHPEQYRGHQANRHSVGYQRTFEAGRFDDLPPCSSSGDLASGGVATCTNCHNVEDKCDSCHSRHTFDAAQARDPLACATCHMGPDHPQWEIYQASKHGVVYETEGPGAAPTCSTCHMAKKRTALDGSTYTDHDLSFGIAYGPVGGMPSHRSIRRGGQLPYVLNAGVIEQNPSFDPAAAVDVAGADSNPDSAFADDLDGTIVQVVDPAGVLSARRQEMLSVCDACHARSWSEYRLDVADGMHDNAHMVVDEANDILRALYFDNLLLPPVPTGMERPPNPDAAIGTLVLGGPMVYRNLTHIERLYFKMYKYDFVKTWHGAYHANPDYAHWYGWAELNLGFADISDAALEIRRDYALEYAIETGASTVWEVPHQGVYWQTGSMNEVYDLFPATSNTVDANGSGTPTVYTGLTFH